MRSFLATAPLIALTFAHASGSSASIATAPPAVSPLKVIEHAHVTAACSMLREDVAPSVGDVLRNDVAIQQAGAAVSRMASSIALAPEPVTGGMYGKSSEGGGSHGDDSPYDNPGVAFAQIRLLQLGDALVRNAADANRLLNDPRYADLADPQIVSIRQAVQTVLDQQQRLANVIFAMAYSSHPADLQMYPPSIQDQVRETIRSEPRRSVVSGDIFGPVARIANQNIARTHILEDAAAARIVTMAPTCGDVVASPVPRSAQGVIATAPLNASPASPSVNDRARSSAAQTTYQELAQDRLDRSRLSATLNDELTPSFLDTLSQQLSLLGTPHWRYDGDGSVSGKPALVFTLSYSNGIVLYYGYGADDNGVVVALFIGTQPPR